MWSYETAGNSQAEDVFEKLTNNKELSKTLAKFADLYGYFCKYPPKNASSIQKSVFMDKAGMIPFFNENMSKKIVESWKTIHDPRKHNEYIKQRIRRAKLKRGGQVGPTEIHDESETLDNFIDYVINLASSKADEILQTLVPGFADEIERIANIGPWILGIPKRIIDNLEDNPYIGGPLLKAATDLFLEITPKFLMVEELGVTAISAPLAPIGGLGVLTEMIGLFIGESLGMLSFAIALSKGKKGAAFLNFIQLVPVFGPLLRQSIVNGIQIYDKFQSERAVLAQIPIIGSFLGGEPVYTQSAQNVTNGGRTRTKTKRNVRNRRTYTKSQKMDRIRR
jgi:hypothetical protein